MTPVSSDGHHGLAAPSEHDEPRRLDHMQSRCVNNGLHSRLPEQQHRRQQDLHQKLQRIVAHSSDSFNQRFKPPLLVSPSLCNGSISQLSCCSTTTTFYSGVKLAPPVQNATVEQVQRRSSDQRAWYTIQVFPYDITISPSTSTITGKIPTHSSGAVQSHRIAATTSIPRKAYKIYRRYDDIADFADQLEEEFPILRVTAATLATKVASAQREQMCSSADTSALNLAVEPIDDWRPLASQSVAATTTAVNVHPGPTSLNVTTLTPPICLPRLKSSLVLFVTKAVCQQRKEELDRYLHELFALGPFIAHSRLVAEFFGIWKTDMEFHLRQEDRDPLALHTVVVHATTTTTNITTATTPTTISPATTAIKVRDENKEEPDNKEDGEPQEQEQEQEQEHEQESKASTIISAISERSSTLTIEAEPIAATTGASTMDLVPDVKTKSSISIASPRTSCSFSSVSALSSSSTSFPSILLDINGLNSEDTMSVAATNTFNYLASPSVSPSPSMVGSRISEWTIPLSSSADNDTSDLEMASPTASPPSSPYAPQFSGKPHSSTSRGGHGDITTRTIKKLKSLRRAHTTTSTSSTRQSALHQYQQQQPPQEGRPAREESREISAALTVNNYRLSMTSTAAGGGATVGASSNPPLLPVPTGTHSQGVKDKPKFMKRSKTIVFRPEVTMQPLSSKNVIPPWNRIPSVITPNISTTSPNSTTAATGTRTPTSSIHSPISPVSPTTPVSGGNHHPFMAFFSSNVSPKNAMIVGESATATTPTYKDPEERPRKLAMSQSKTMPSLALWSMDGSASAKGPSSPRSPVSANPFHSNISEGNSTVRALLTSSYSATTLIAPWNRANSSSETNTHLHSLIKVSSSSSSGQASASLLSPAELPSVPVELGRSFQKKDFNQQQRSLQQSQAVLSKTNKEHSPIPVLSHPPECRNRSGTTSNRQITNSPGMSHSVSAPGGFLPLMTISKPTADSTNKRRPTRRESTTGVLTPTKQPVGILKNAQQSIIGARKSSLTVPGTAMFPVQPPSPSTPTFGLCHHPHGPSVVTTFKIVMDADTIVALQVIEDRKFILTLDDLKTRVKSKLLKSNIQLPEAFDLFWNMPSTAPSTPSTPLSVSTVSSLSSPTSGVTLRNDEDLHRAIHSSKNHKVTLRCIF